ncbi:MAG TPA: hypothetical protein VFM10_12855 [Terriglobales bacterium]|nr:hypothetical protein [Terriglobales bacterium]
MAANKKPRKRYRPRYQTEDYNPIAAGIAATRVFTEDEAADRRARLAGCIERATQGRGEHEDWDAILFAWNTVDAMAGIPGVMVNGKAAARLFGDVLLEIAARYDEGKRAFYPHERESFQQFLELYSELIYNVPLKIWAIAERKAVQHRANVKRHIENEAIAEAYSGSGEEP